MKDFESRYEEMLVEIERLIGLTNKRSVLILFQHTKADDVYPCVPAVRESISNVLGFVALGDEKYLPYIMEKAVGIIDTVIIDVDPKRENSLSIRRVASCMAKQKGIPVSYYSAYASWVSSAVAFVSQIEQKENKDVYEFKHLLVGRNELATRMILEMIGRGLDVYLLESEYPTLAFPIAGGEMTLNSSHIHFVDPEPDDIFDTLLGCGLRRNCQILEKLFLIRFSYVYDVGIGNFTVEFVERQRKNGADIYRLDDRAGISGNVINLMETSELIKLHLGKTKLGDISIVSGGYVGEEGDVVVDNYNDPRIIFGIAKGDGTFKSELTPDDESKIMKIEKLL